MAPVMEVLLLSLYELLVRIPKINASFDFSTRMYEWLPRGIKNRNLGKGLARILLRMWPRNSNFKSILEKFTKVDNWIGHVELDYAMNSTMKWRILYVINFNGVHALFAWMSRRSWKRKVSSWPNFTNSLSWHIRLIDCVDISIGKMHFNRIGWTVLRITICIYWRGDLVAGQNGDHGEIARKDF